LDTLSGKLASMSGTLTAQSVSLGAALRQLRTEAGIKQVDACRHLGASDGSLLSRWETGTRVPSDDDVTRLCELYGASVDHAEYLVALADLARTPGWWDHEAIPPWFARYISSEHTARSVRSYSQLIPGLLQTREYVDALAMGYASGSPSPVAESLVVVRTRRQLRLTGRDPLHLHVVIDEEAFRRPMGGLRVMREQIGQLRAMARRPNVEIQVLPVVPCEHPGLFGPFTILSFPERSMDLVYVERPRTADYLTDSEEVAFYEEDFEVLAKMALDEQGTDEWLAKTEQELG
jgi:transcriptional regulator with XRE-family HTH domain